MSDDAAKKETAIFRDIIKLMTDPKTARRFAEMWNESDDMAFGIDMDDPDAPWNQKEYRVELWETYLSCAPYAVRACDARGAILEAMYANHQATMMWMCVVTSQEKQETFYNVTVIDGDRPGFVGEAIRYRQYGVVPRSQATPFIWKQLGE